MNKEDIEEKIIEEKLKGLSDFEIGEKYKVSYKFIEKVFRKFYGVALSNLKEKKIKKIYPDKFEIENTTVWSFKNRGNWATHSGEYRGNWSPYIPRNIILRYSFPGDTILDPFCGGGTTCIEAKLLGRKCIGVDINEKAVELAKKNLEFEIDGLFPIYAPEIKVGDARNLWFIEDNSIDLICTHPPYANAIHYTNKKEGDLSWLNIEEFLLEIKKVAKEFFRVLKPGKKCVFLIGDLRKKKYIIPLGFKVIDIFQKEGFLLKDLIIKRQHNCKTTGFWYEKSLKYNFLLLAHEYLPIFEKPFSKFLTEKEIIMETSETYLTNFKLKVKNKLSSLETTTLWIFPKEKFEENLNKNIIERYGPDKLYSIFYFLPNNQIIFNNSKKLKNGKISLLYIKILSEEIKEQKFLNFLIQRVFQESTNLKEKGYLVMHTKDIRTTTGIFPTGKEIVINFEKKLPFLKLKEIIIASFYENKEFTDIINNFEIVHSYILVFEKNAENN